MIKRQGAASHSQRRERTRERPRFRLLSIGTLLALGLLLFAQAGVAHEVRPAYWQIEETEPGLLSILWKQPVLADEAPGMARRLAVDPVLPTECELLDQQLPIRTRGAIVQHSQARCPTSLTGLEFRVTGLERTLMDVLLHIETANGRTFTALLRPTAPSFSLGAPHDTRVPAYLSLGIQHMLQGFDHLLFVLGLILLSRKVWTVVRLITAFTVAHSITLGLTVLGFVSLPQGPVEALIALSILFLAVELLQPETERSLAARHSWTLAFGFGLLHGFGFAGALAEIGLPEQAKIPALFLFNLGVEVGQLLTVVVLILSATLVRRLIQRGHRSRSSFSARTPGMFGQRRFFNPTAIAAIAMGTISAYWFVERFVGLL